MFIKLKIKCIIMRLIALLVVMASTMFGLYVYNNSPSFEIRYSLSGKNNSMNLLYLTLLCFPVFVFAASHIYKKNGREEKRRNIFILNITLLAIIIAWYIIYMVFYKIH